MSVEQRHVSREMEVPCRSLQTVLGLANCRSYRTAGPASQALDKSHEANPEPSTSKSKLLGLSLTSRTLRFEAKALN